MDLISGILNYPVAFLFVLTVVVFVHEFGHYMVARWCGIRVEVFSIGFGPEIFGWDDSRQTRWKVSWIPLGGYVKFFGDADATSQPDRDTERTTEEQRQTFQAQPLWARAAVVAAGPVTNFIAAVIILSGLFVVVGQPFTPPVVDKILPGTAAEEAGFEIGDRIKEIDGRAIMRFEELQQIIMASPGQRLDVVVLRGNKRLALGVTPGTRLLEDRFGNQHKVGYLGIQRRALDHIKHGPFDAVWYATRETYYFTTQTLRNLGQIITGLRPADDLRGPIGIIRMSGQAAQLGISSLLQFTAILSISLGLINLFPVPPLDGGHLLYYGFEAVRGRPLGHRAQDFGVGIGLALVVMLMVFVTRNDLTAPWVLDLFARLFS